MTVYVALLRAVNVGGTGTLPMARLAALCRELGFGNVRTYIQSGNAVFSSPTGEDAVRSALEAALTAEMGRPADVVVRTAAELGRVASANPFPEADGTKVAVVMGHATVNGSAIEGVVAPGGEEVVAGPRELYVHYPDGMGRSKFRLPGGLGPVTARNMNTVRKLVELADRGDLPGGLGKAAERALAAAGITSLDQLAGLATSELEAVHGIGPKAIGLLRAALEERGLTFAPG